MAKLFAFEEMDTDVSTEIDEVSPEQAQAPVEAADLNEETGDIVDHAEAIDEAGDAVDNLEEVQEVIETAADEEGGLSPVAAEAIGIAIKSICARIGVQPKRLYSIYATENFSSSSTRMANTKIALEGVREFLENLWDQIKKHIRSLWEKVKAFWAKHFSKVGRNFKMLEALDRRVGSLKKDKPTEETSIDLSGSLASAFGWETKTDSTLVEKIINVQIEYSKNSIYLAEAVKVFAKGAKSIASEAEKIETKGQIVDKLNTELKMFITSLKLDQNHL